LGEAEEIDTVNCSLKMDTGRKIIKAGEEKTEIFPQPKKFQPGLTNPNID
jgi:hypothetical protein